MGKLIQPVHQHQQLLLGPAVPSFIWLQYLGHSCNEPLPLLGLLMEDGGQFILAEVNLQNKARVHHGLFVQDLE